MAQAGIPRGRTSERARPEPFDLGPAGPSRAPTTAGRRQANATSATRSRRRGISASILSGLAGFVLGAIFWHFVGFWSFVSHVVLKGPAADPNGTSSSVGIETGSLPPARRELRARDGARLAGRPGRNSRAAEPVATVEPPPVAEPPAVEPAVAVPATSQPVAAGPADSASAASAGSAGVDAARDAVETVAAARTGPLPTFAPSLPSSLPAATGTSAPPVARQPSGWSVQVDANGR